MPPRFSPFPLPYAAERLGHMPPPCNNGDRNILVGLSNMYVASMGSDRGLSLVFNIFKLFDICKVMVDFLLDRWSENVQACEVDETHEKYGRIG